MSRLFTPSLIIVFSILSLAACQSASVTPVHPIVAAYSESWNEKDINKMAALMHPDIKWMSVKDDAIVVEISGKLNLVAEMQNWFDGPDLPRGSLRDWSINGNFVAVTETATWKNKQGKLQSQSSLTVYELRNKLIHSVYYYPSVEN